jgi:hypothetical protein
MDRRRAPGKSSPLVLSGLIALVSPFVGSEALAGSTAGSAGSGGGGAVQVEFRLTIPKFLRLQVGSAGTAVEQISLAPAAQQLATSPSTLVSGAGGEGSGAVTVKVQASPGADDVNLTYRTIDSSGTGLSSLSDGSNDVPWSTVKVSTGGAGAASLAHPASLGDASVSDVAVAAPVPKVAGIINLSATWRYSWDDGGTIYPASGTGGYRGRVSYKLSTP